MPRGRSSGDRIADLESRLQDLEKRRRRAADSASRQDDYSAEELQEIGLILLREAHQGDTQAFAEHLQELGLTFDEAEAWADHIGRVLEERGAER